MVTRAITNPMSEKNPSSMMALDSVSSPKPMPRAAITMLIQADSRRARVSCSKCDRSFR
jgi:hypothetical protein